MAKKKRIKLTLYGCVEGVREQLFLKTLVEIYRPRDNHINPSFKFANGGSPDVFVKAALIECHRDRSFAWFDQDFEPELTLGREMRERVAQSWNIPSPDNAFYQCPVDALQATYNLARRKPVLIVSQPVCVESLIIKTLGHIPPVEQFDPQDKKKQIRDLKAHLGGLIGGAVEEQFYIENLTKEMLEAKRREIPELDLLISMITP